jgi:hypothetical protein
METTTQIEKHEYEFRFFRKHTIWYTCPITVSAESVEDAKRIVLESMKRANELGETDELGYLYFQDSIDLDYSMGEYQYDTVENCDDGPGVIEIQCYADGFPSDPFYSSK